MLCQQKCLFQGTVVTFAYLQLRKSYKIIIPLAKSTNLNRFNCMKGDNT